MSTKARKARKSAGVKFVRTPKVGTPVTERAENQPRNIYVQGTRKVARFGLPSRVIARLKAYGIEAKK